MSSREFGAWIAYTRHEPVGPARLDMLTAMQMALIANANRDAKTRPEPFQPSDFLPQWWPEPDTELDEAPVETKQTPQEIYAALKTWAVLSGAKKVQ